MHSTATPLARRLTGRTVMPGDPGWDRARRAFNLSVDQRPQAIAFPVDERDVVAAVDHARRSGLRIAAQSTGHGAGALGPLDDVLLVNLSGIGGVEVDVAARRVRVGAGVAWRSVTRELSDHGLAALHGSSPGVGIVGYSLSGGMGWLARRYGLQADSVTAVELVTADGEVVRADAGDEPQLFWALRGGGGGLGVVTAIEFAVQPVAELYAGAMFFAPERASEVLQAWAEQLPGFPDDLTSWASIVRLPDAAHLPAAVRGRAFAVVSGAHLGGEAGGRELLRPVRELGPEIDTFAMVPPLALGDLAMDPPNPVPYESVHQLLDGLPGGAVDDLVAAASPALAKVQLRHTGGALGRRRPGAGALGALPGNLSLFALGVTPDARSRAAVRSALDGVDAALRPFRAGEYAGFVDEPADGGRFHDPQTLDRLREVKALYDPSDLFAGGRVRPADPEARSHVPRDARRRPGRPGALAVASPPAAVVRPVDDHRWSPSVVVFEGGWDGVEASVYVTTFDAGKGPRLHRHPYPEVFLVQDGVARFHAGGEHRDVPAGHFVVVAAGTPHRYESVGQGPATVVSVHPSGTVRQEDLGQG